MEKLFKTSLFGYRKKDVINYLDSLNAATEKEIGRRDDLAEDLRNSLEDEKEKLASLTEKYEKLLSDSQSISEAIISAQKQADEIISKATSKSEKIVEDARLEAIEIKDTAKEELCALESKKSSVTEEIRKLKNTLILSASKYKDDLDKLIKE